MAKVAEVLVRIKGDDQLSGPLKNIANQFRSLDGMFSGMGKGIGGMTVGLMNAANAVYLLEKGAQAVNFAFDVAVGTVRLFTDEIVKSVQAASEFEYAMVAVTSKSDALGDSLKSADLEKTAIDLAKLSKFSPTEVAAGMEKLAMSGFNTAQIMGAMPGVIALATAANTDLATSGDIATNIMMAFGVAAEDMMASADTMTAALINSNMSIMDLQQGMKFIGPAANRMGMSIGDAAAALGVLNNVGLKAGIAGRGLRSAFVSLFDPSIKAQGYLEKLGITVDDGTGNLKNMTTLLEDFSKALAGMNEVETTEALNAIFTTEGATAFGAILDNMDEYYKLLGKVGDASGLSQKIQDQYLNTIQGRWEQLNETIYGIRIQIGQKFNPVLKEMIVTFQKFLEQNTGKIVQFFTVFADLLRETWGFAQKVADAFKNGGIDAGFKELRKGLGSFATQIEKIGRDWKNWWARIQSSAQFQGLKKDIIKGLSDIGTAIFNKLRQWGAKFWEWIDKKILPDTPGVFASLGKVILTAIGNLIISITQKLSELVKGFWDWTAGVETDSSKQIGGIMTAIGEAIKNNWETIVLTALGWAFGGWWGAILGLVLPGIGPNLGLIIGNTAEYLKQNWPTIKTSLATWGENFWTWTDKVKTDAAKEIDDMLKAINRAIGGGDNEAGSLYNPVDTQQSGFEAITQTLQQKAGEWKESVLGWIDQASAEAPARAHLFNQALADSLNGDVLQANIDFYGWQEKFWENLIPSVADITNNLINITEAFKQWANSEQATKDMEEVGVGLGKNLAVGTANFLMGVGGVGVLTGIIVVGFSKAIANAQQGMGALGASLVSGIMQGVYEGLTGEKMGKEMSDKLTGGLKLAVESVIDAVAPLPVKIYEGVEAIIKLIEKIDELRGKLSFTGIVDSLGLTEEAENLQTGLNTIQTGTIEENMKNLQGVLLGLKNALPDWLKPGSPPPLAYALWDIGQALTDMPPINEAFPVAATEQATALHQAIVNIGQTLLNTIVPAFDQVIARTRVLWGLFNQLRGITLQWSGSLNTLTKAINNVTAAMTRLNSAMDRFSTPDTLTPGSPTPFELGLRGIADAIQGMPQLALGGAPMMPAGGGVINYYVTVGGVSATSTSAAGDSNADEAIQMTVNLLRQALGRG